MLVHCCHHHQLFLRGKFLRFVIAVTAVIVVFLCSFQIADAFPLISTTWPTVTEFRNSQVLSTDERCIHRSFLPSSISIRTKPAAIGSLLPWSSFSSRLWAARGDDDDDDKKDAFYFAYDDTLDDGDGSSNNNDGDGDLPFFSSPASDKLKTTDEIVSSILEQQQQIEEQQQQQQQQQKGIDTGNLNDDRQKNRMQEKTLPYFSSATSRDQFKMTDGVPSLLEQQQAQQQQQTGNDEDGNLNDDRRKIRMEETTLPYFSSSTSRDQFKMTEGVVSSILEQQQEQKGNDEDGNLNDDIQEIRMEETTLPYVSSATSRDQFKMTDEIVSYILEQPQQQQQQQENGNGEDGNVDDEMRKNRIRESILPYFSSDQFKMMNKVVSLMLEQQLQQQQQQEQMEKEQEQEQIQIDREIIRDRDARAVAKRRANSKKLYKLADSFQASVDAMPENFDKTEAVVLEAIALTKSLPSKMEETVEKTQQAVKDVQEIPNKLNQSVQDTKRNISKKQESVRETVSGVKVFLGMERPSLRSRWYRKIPMTSKEVALDLTGKATIATGKVVLWTGKGVTSLAWKGTQSAYNKGKETIGPVVEKAWNEQVDSLNSSINTTSTTIKSVPSKMKSAATRSSQPSFANTKKSKADSNSEKENVINTITKITKSPAELDKQMQDAQNLANEISDALDLAERVMKMNSSELDDPMIKIEKFPTRTKPSMTPPSIAENVAFVNKKSKRKTANEVLARFKTAKTQDELDIEIEEAQALAKEVSDALEIAEQALMMASTTSSSTNHSDELESKTQKEALAKEVSDALEMAEQALMMCSTISSSNNNSNKLESKTQKEQHTT